MDLKHHDHPLQKHRHEGHGDDFDPGVMYQQQWVQDLVGKIQDFVRSNVSWIGVDSSRLQRILDYACGHGTITLALVESCPKATFQGIDSHPKQVQRYNDEAHKLFGEDKDRMFALQGDLGDLPFAPSGSKWFSFDVAIMSMALHHIPDPVNMLSLLRERLRSGGTVVIVEWFYTDSETQPRTVGDHLEQDNMIEVIGGQKIWDGFTPAELKNLVGDAGFRDIELKVLEEPIYIPDFDGNAFASRDKSLMFVKAVT